MLNGSSDCTQQLPINTGRMRIDTPMFEGVMEVNFRGLSTTNKQLFEGKKRFFQVMAQVCIGSDGHSSCLPASTVSAIARGLARLQATLCAVGQLTRESRDNIGSSTIRPSVLGWSLFQSYASPHMEGSAAGILCINPYSSSRVTADLCSWVCRGDSSDRLLRMP